MKIYKVVQLHRLHWMDYLYDILSDWRRLDSFHTRCQRRIIHISWYDHVTNDEVLRRTGLLVASSIVRK